MVTLLILSERPYSIGLRVRPASEDLLFHLKFVLDETTILYSMPSVNGTISISPLFEFKKWY